MVWTSWDSNTYNHLAKNEPSSKGDIWILETDDSNVPRGYDVWDQRKRKIDFQTQNYPADNWLYLKDAFFSNIFETK